MIYLSNLLIPVIAGDDSIITASGNTKIIYDIINDPNANDFDIMVDVGGIIYLAPYDDGSHVHSVLNGNLLITPPLNANRATWSLTFQYGASFATTDKQATIMSIKNFQVEASEKAFLFETINDLTRVEVTDLYNSRASVCWFGAVADCTNSQSAVANATDNHMPFNRAIKCFKNLSHQTFTWKNFVDVPASLGVNNNLYCLKNPLILHSNVQLVGVGKAKSQLFFPNEGGGITVSESNNEGGSAANCVISNLTLFGPLLIYSPTYDKGNGITIRATCSINEVLISSFDGNGIHLSANIVVNTNANRTQINNVSCRGNSINGILVDTADRGSGDTNACLITAVSVVSNGACGIRDQSFLGNTYVGCHSATNSVGTNNRSRVFNNGTRYICIQDNSGTIEPGITSGWENYWVENGTLAAPDTTYKQWQLNNTYLMSFGYAFISSENKLNNQSLLVGSYSESDQKTIFNGSFWNNVVTSMTDNLVIGGTIGGGGKSPGHLYNRNNVICAQNFRATDDVAANTPDKARYSMISNTYGDATDKGGFRINVPIMNQAGSTTNKNFTYGYISQYKAFGFYNQWQHGLSQMFVFKDSFEQQLTENVFGSRSASTYDIYPTMMQPMFMKHWGRGYARLFGYNAENPQSYAELKLPGCYKGDLFLMSKVLNTGQKYKNPIGWRCVGNPTELLPNGEWETLHYFEPAQPSPDSASAAGPSYSQAQVQEILDELRDLKTKMRVAGILLT